MKGSIEFFVAFLIVSWGVLAGVEVARVVLMTQNLHAYRDFAVYTIEHHNGYSDDVIAILKEKQVCQPCEISVKSDKDRVYVVTTVPIEMAAFQFKADLSAQGTAYLGK